MRTKIIRQTVTFKANPRAIYNALMDSRKHAKFTGAKASISRRVNGKFTAYNGSLSGQHLELVRDKKISQSWNCKMEGWPTAHYSTATFTLKKISGGTQLRFIQSGVPAQCYDSINQGWHDYYWNPMRRLLER